MLLHRNSIFYWCIHIPVCVDKQCKEVSSAVMALTVMFNKAHCEISILSLSLFTLLKSLTFQLTTERFKLTPTFNFMS